MEIAYTKGPHLQQPVPDKAVTTDFLPSMPQLPFIVEPGTQTFYVHPATSGFIVEMGSGGLVNATA